MALVPHTKLSKIVRIQGERSGLRKIMMINEMIIYTHCEMLWNDALLSSICKKYSVSRETDVRSLDGGEGDMMSATFLCHGCLCSFQTRVLGSDVLALSTLPSPSHSGRMCKGALPFRGRWLIVARACHQGEWGGERTGVPRENVGPASEVLVLQKHTCGLLHGLLVEFWVKSI